MEKSAVKKTEIYFEYDESYPLPRKTLFKSQNRVTQRREPVSILINHPPDDFFKAVFEGRTTPIKMEGGAQGSVITDNVFYVKGKNKAKTKIALKISPGAKKEIPVREAKLASKINSKHVVKILGYGIGTLTKLKSSQNKIQVRKFGYIAMEICNKGSLKQMMKMLARNRKNIPVEEKQVYLRFEQLCKGLKAIHDGGIKHHDLKPGNIMVHKEKEDDQSSGQSDWVLKIGDFGFAVDQEYIEKNIDIQERGSLVMAGGNAGHGFGTEGYFPPELIPSILDYRIGERQKWLEKAREKSYSKESEIFKKSVSDLNQAILMKKIMEKHKWWGGFARKMNRGELILSGEKADIFTLGLILFYLIRGEHYGLLIDSQFFDFKHVEKERLKRQGKDLVNLVQWMTQVDFEKRPRIDEVIGHPWMMKMKSQIRPEDRKKNTLQMSKSLEMVATDLEVFRELFLLRLRDKITEEVERKLDEIYNLVSFFLEENGYKGNFKPFLEDFTHYQATGKEDSDQIGVPNEGSVVNYLLGYAVMKKSCYLYAGFLEKMGLRDGQDMGLVSRMMTTKSQRKKLEKWDKQMKTCLGKLKFYKKALGKILPKSAMEQLEHQSPNNQLFSAIMQWLVKYLKEESYRQLLYYHGDKISAQIGGKKVLKEEIKKTYKNLVLNFSTLMRTIELFRVNLGYLSYTYDSKPKKFKEIFNKKLVKQIERSKEDLWILHGSTKSGDILGLERYLTSEMISQDEPIKTNKNSEKFKELLVGAFGLKEQQSTETENLNETIEDQTCFFFDVRFENWMLDEKSDPDYKVNRALEGLVSFLKKSLKAFGEEKNNLGGFEARKEEIRFIKKHFSSLISTLPRVIELY